MDRGSQGKVTDRQEVQRIFKQASILSVSVAEPPRQSFQIAFALLVPPPRACLC